MSERVYAVIRIGWEIGGPDYPWEGANCRLREPEYGRDGHPVAAFTDRASAERLCRELEANARRELGSPVRFEGWDYWTEVWDDRTGRSDHDELILRIMELGIEPPETIDSPYGIYHDWLRWWDSVAGSITKEQRDALWDLATKLRLYEVRELEIE